MEKEYKIEVTIIKQMCNLCGNEMKNTNTVLRHYPPIYLHKCTYCDNEETFSEKYPKTIYPEEK